MKKLAIKSHVRAGAITHNHNPTRPLIIKSRVRAGALTHNHNPTRR
jgi:hypothetical protein